MALLTDVVRSGQINSAGDLDALYLDMFSGEVLRTFSQKNRLLPLVRSKVIGAGKSFQFPAISEAVANYHVQGKNILDTENSFLSEFEHAAATINVDKVLLAAAMVDDWEELIKHYESRSEYARKLGEALSNKMDKQLFITMANAADADATLKSQQLATLDFEQTPKDGFVSSAASASTSPSVMLGEIIKAATNFAEKDVPMDELYFFVRPSMYYGLANSGELIDRDFNDASNGSRADGKVVKGYGFNIMWSNHLPFENLAIQDPGDNNGYIGDFRQCAAIGFAKDAVATVLRRGIVTQAEYRQDYLATHIQSHIVCGHGVLRPECAALIKDSSLPLV